MSTSIKKAVSNSSLITILSGCAFNSRPNTDRGAIGPILSAAPRSGGSAFGICGWRLQQKPGVNPGKSKVFEAETNRRCSSAPLFWIVNQCMRPGKSGKFLLVIADNFPAVDAHAMICQRRKIS
jgi:hypothetical protein